MKDSVEIAAQKVIELGKLSLLFGRTYRVTYHDDGETPESDTDHTVMLALIACSLADSFVPRLDRGRVAEFALVHDLVEAYAGDVATMKPLSPEQKAQKEKDEHDAYLKIQSDFEEIFPWLPKTIAEYEKREEPEARFVKILDKMVAKVTHTLNKGAAMQKMAVTRQEIDIWHKQQEEWADTHLQEWPEVRPIWKKVIAHAHNEIVAHKGFAL